MSEDIDGMKQSIESLTVRELIDLKVEIDKTMRKLKEVESKCDKIINSK